MSDGAFVQKVTRFMPRCFVCRAGFDGTPMMREEAEAVVAAHNAKHHPDLERAGD